MEKAIRQPLIVCVGHVDAGKTKLLDQIRGTAVGASEAGGITQSIGCSHVPLSTIKAICGDLLSALSIDFTIPGLLFIDTPGHAAFTNLRRRGGNLADIAILVIDLNEGFKPQTYEAIEILKSFKTPFIVAANKVDLVPGWHSSKEMLLKNIGIQSDPVKQKIDIKLYDLVGKLSGLGFNSERFDRIDNYTQQIAIIPCSAKTGEGIPELLMVISGLAQKYLEESLKTAVEGDAKGTVLEIKKDKGLGTTMDVIIYDGVIRKGDMMAIGGLNGAVVTKVKALFEPAPLAEMRDKAKFYPVDEVRAAAGVKVSALDIESVVAGAPIRTFTPSDEERVKAEVQAEVEDVLIETDREGVVVKADTLGSLEALLRLLKEKNILVKRASIGEVTRKDFVTAEANYDKSPLNAAVLAFNVPAEIEPGKVKLISSKIIYRLIEELEQWQLETSRNIEARDLENLVRPCKFKILQGYVFRQNNPAIVGVEILAGILSTGTQITKDGKVIGSVKAIQLEQESITTAEKGKQVAVSIENATVGRQINENDEIFIFIPEEDFRKLKKLAKYLSKDEIAVLKELAEIMRRENPMWGV